jgi:hypothetical protein
MASGVEAAAAAYDDRCPNTIPRRPRSRTARSGWLRPRAGSPRPCPRRRPRPVNRVWAAGERDDLAGSAAMTTSAPVVGEGGQTGPRGASAAPRGRGDGTGVTGARVVRGGGRGRRRARGTPRGQGTGPTCDHQTQRWLGNSGTLASWGEGSAVDRTAPDLFSKVRAGNGRSAFGLPPPWGGHRMDCADHTGATRPRRFCTGPGPRCPGEVPPRRHKRVITVTGTMVILPSWYNAGLPPRGGETCSWSPASGLRRSLSSGCLSRSRPVPLGRSGGRWRGAAGVRRGNRRQPLPIGSVGGSRRDRRQVPPGRRGWGARVVLSLAGHAWGQAGTTRFGLRKVRVGSPVGRVGTTWLTWGRRRRTPAEVGLKARLRRRWPLGVRHRSGLATTRGAGRTGRVDGYCPFPGCGDGPGCRRGGRALR